MLSKKKIQEMISSPSCCAGLKEVGRVWLDVVKTDKESTATRKLLVEIKEDIMPIDGMISFAESERCVQMFGEKGGRQICWHMEKKSWRKVLYIVIA